MIRTSGIELYVTRSQFLDFYDASQETHLKHRYTGLVGDKKPKKNSSGSGDAFKAKQAKIQADKFSSLPKDDKKKK